jgi:hypothetical protein
VLRSTVKLSNRDSGFQSPNDFRSHWKLESAAPLGLKFMVVDRFPGVEATPGFTRSPLCGFKTNLSTIVDSARLNGFAGYFFSTDVKMDLAACWNWDFENWGMNSRSFDPAETSCETTCQAFCWS